VREAFSDEATAELVQRIRRSANYIPPLSMVAEVGGQIVGHIMLSHLVRDDGANAHRVVTLSPVSDRPDRQNQGVGAAVIEAVIARADQQGEALIVLEGSPAYYPRGSGFGWPRRLGSSSNCHRGRCRRRRWSIRCLGTDPRSEARSCIRPRLME
jgi:putative acetyltransferase